MKRKDNFFNSKIIVISKKLQKKIKSNPLINMLYITAIGYYPYAQSHFQHRKKAISENILIYCINGSGIIQLSKQFFQIEANSFFVIPSNEPYVYRALEHDPWTIYCLHFSGEKSRYFEKFFRKTIRLPSGPLDRTSDRINLFEEIFSVFSLGFSNENIEFANLLFYNLLASFFYIEPYRASKRLQRINPIDKAIFFMQQNLRQCLKIQDIANYVQLSESYFSKLFKDFTGFSPIKYFINLKMQEAVSLIMRHFYIKEVAFKLGFNDPLYFSRLFKKQIGLSPTEFRRKDTIKNELKKLKK